MYDKGHRLFQKERKQWTDSGIRGNPGSNFLFPRFFGEDERIESIGSDHKSVCRKVTTKKSRCIDHQFSLRNLALTESSDRNRESFRHWCPFNELKRQGTEEVKLLTPLTWIDTVLRKLYIVWWGFESPTFDTE